MYPVFALLALTIVWLATLDRVRREVERADRSARLSARELGDTYEAQVIRAIREIDAAIGVVAYAVERSGAEAGLADLEERGLLPPSLLFAVGVADTEGRIIAATREGLEVYLANHPALRSQPSGDFALTVGPPLRDPASGEWSVAFARRLESSAEPFEGVAVVVVDADFFVSGYDAARLGSNGVLAVVGTDGVVRVRRTADATAYGDALDPSSLLAMADDEDERSGQVLETPWDGVARYTAVQTLYQAPLAVVVGLSRAEQLELAAALGRTYYTRAGVASLVLLLVLGGFGRLSWKLGEARKREIAAREEHARQVEHMAYHDGLTGLANRNLFTRLLDQAILRARRSGREFAVMFMDLDRFKHINDSLGHEAGDELLIETARRLESCVRRTDTVARLGGDEFVVLLSELSEAVYAATVADKIIASIAQPFSVKSHDVRVTASLGIATYPGDGPDEETLTKNADIAMYNAKEQGKNGYRFYSDKMTSESLERMSLEVSLRRALEKGEFEVHYQPKGDLATGRITGTEALLRWQHPQLGTIAPLKFLPVAEASGLIIPIGKWVLHTACEQNRAWQRQGLPAVGLSVNLTRKQFLDEHLAADVASILDLTGFEPGLLELEISELTLMSDVDRSVRILEILRATGVRVAIDDFGSGYTTLASLERFPVTTIKIDRSFIHHAATAGDGESLTDAVIAMGKALSVTVVAQGVETREQLEYLRDHACDEVQGFYFNVPIAAADFPEVWRVHDLDWQPLEAGRRASADAVTKPS